MACRGYPRLPLGVGVAALFVVSCGTDAPEVPYTIDPAVIPTVTLGEATFTLESTGACTLDIDCAAMRYCVERQCVFDCSPDFPCGTGETCSASGRCVADADGLQATDVSATSTGLSSAEKAFYRNLAVTGVPAARIPMRTWPEAESGTLNHQSYDAQGQIEQDYRSIEFRFASNDGTPIRSGPARGFWHRIERDDDPSADGFVRYAPIVAHEDGTISVRIRVAVGAALASLPAPEDVFLRIRTPTLTTRVLLDAAPPAAGTYGGGLRMDMFGGADLPIGFQIVTRPARSTLEQAEAAWFVLEIDPFSLWRPYAAPWEVSSAAMRPEDGAKVYEAAPITWDPTVSRWTASFTNAFALGGEVIAGRGAAAQVERLMRFDFEIDDTGLIFGNVRDRWSGLFNTLTSGGLAAPASVFMQGRFEARQSGTAMLESALVAHLGEQPSRTAANPQVLPTPPLDACTDAMLMVDPVLVGVGEDATTYECFSAPPSGMSAIQSVAQFEAADEASRAQCAIAVARSALSGQTTSSLVLAFVSEDTDVTAGQSFDDFLMDCAGNTVNGPCVPAPEVGCARQLLAYAYAEETSETDNTPEMLSAFIDVSRELFLGPQFAAFYTDMQTRKLWLQFSEVKGFAQAALADWFIEQLREWKTQVVDRQVALVRDQLDASGLALLARPVTGPAADDRSRLLLEMSQTWRGAMDAVTAAARRWNGTMKSLVRRQAAGDEITAITFELYLAASVLSSFNALNGNKAFNSAFGAGFAGLAGVHAKLNLPFDRLIYLRDAEMLLATSLLPDTTTDSVLVDRRDDALRAIANAKTAIAEILDDVQANAITEAATLGSIRREIDTVKNDLIALCGIPVGCELSDVKDEVVGCDVRVEPGLCGFVVAKAYAETEPVSDQPSTSDAGNAVLAYSQALQEIKIADEEYKEHSVMVDIAKEMLESAKADTITWAAQRREKHAELVALADEVESKHEGALKALAARIEATSALRVAEIENRAEDAKKFDLIRIAGLERTVGYLNNYKALRGQVEATKKAITGIWQKAVAIKEALPTANGLSNDATSGARSGILAAGVAAVETAGAVELAVNEAIRTKEAAENIAQLQEDVEYEEWASEEGVRTLELEEELEAVRAEFETKEFESRPDVALSMMEVLESEMAADAANERDRQEVRKWQDAARTRAAAGSRLLARKELAALKADQRAAEYRQIVQRAQAQEDRLRMLQEQLDDVNSVLGSAAVVFGRASHFEAAETYLARAKSGLMDWLVGLEYLAVRPFINERLLILLATSANQLERISERLDALEGSCGGLVNNLEADLSLKRDLLNIRTGVIGPLGDLTTSHQRFHELLREADIPVDKRIRHGSGDDTLGQLIDRRSNLMAASFVVTLDRFANLSMVCNAKIVGISFQLEGDVGEGLPSLTLLTDGVSQLRSCQPDIDTYVANNTSGVSPYGSLMTVQPPARSVSPVAGIDDFPADNVTLQGQPLAGAYTIMIDTEASNNEEIDWDKLTDIRVRLSYSYQDLFPADSKCGAP